MSKPKGIKSDEFKAYVGESRGLERDYIGLLVKSQSTAWWAARGLGALLGLSLIANAMLSPLKETETVILRVNDTTGAVDVINKMADAQTSYGEVVDRYFLNQYVLRREGYDYNTLQNDYDSTALLSAPDVQQEFFKLYEGKQARDKVLANNVRVMVTVKSITPNPKTQTAVVRFATENRYADGRVEGRADWIATLAYGYVTAPIAEADRRINPLGFQVTSYRVDPEVVTNG